MTDLIRMLHVNLGNTDVDRCPTYRHGDIHIAVIVSCVDALLNQIVCPTHSISTPTPTATPSATPTVFPPPDPAAAIAALEMLESISVCFTGGTPGGSTTISLELAGARLDCGSFTGHTGTFTLLKYPSRAAADTAFGEPEKGESIQELGGGSIRELEWNPFCNDTTTFGCSGRLGASSTRWTWQRECLVASGRTFDDTHFILTPRGPNVIAAMAGSGLLEDLLALCPDE